MFVSNVRQSYATLTGQSGNTLPRCGDAEVNSEADRPNSHARVDMRNVSINEINELIRSGIEGLLDIVPFVPPKIISERGGEYAANIKIDYIGQIQNSIDYRKSIGEDTEFFNNALENIKKIDGMEMPGRIHVIA